MKKEERDRKKIAMNVKENCLRLKIIRDDFVLPPKSLKIGECRKKNQTFGKEKRYIMLGTSQLLFARDENFESIVNVIPLEGGFCMVRPVPKISKQTIHIFCIHRLFEMHFNT